MKRQPTTRRAFADSTARALARATRAIPPRTERVIQAEILRALRAHGIMAYPLNRERAGRERASHIGIKGLPDIGGWLSTPMTSLAIQPYSEVTRVVATPLYVEVKRPGEKLRPAQAAFLALARKAGCVAFKAESPADVARALGWTPSP